MGTDPRPVITMVEACGRAFSMCNTCDKKRQCIKTPTRGLQ